MVAVLSGRIPESTVADRLERSAPLDSPLLKLSQVQAEVFFSFLGVHASIEADMLTRWLTERYPRWAPAAAAIHRVRMTPHHEWTARR